MAPKENRSMNSPNIISSYHHSFAGGSKNTSRLLHYLSKKGHKIDAYFFETPQYFTYTKSSIKRHIQENSDFNSEVIDYEALKYYQFTNQIVESIDSNKKYVLLGANLFPYGNMLHDAKNQLRYLGKNDPKLILHPVGSDMWQVGAKMKSRVKWLLDSPQVDTILTYSDSFIAEIQDFYNIKKSIHVLKPILEKKKFFPSSALKISKKRKELGLQDDTFIMHHHSSMRKIKCPEVVLDIALKSSQKIMTDCVLVMVGTIPFDTIKSLNLDLQRINKPAIFKYKSIKKNLTIYWTDVIQNVEVLIQIADVELNASLHDSFNISILESMACGIPVVTSEVVGIRKHIEESKGGICFPTKKLRFDELNLAIEGKISKKHLFDIDFAINAIVMISKNRIMAKKQGIAGATYVAKEFDQKSVVQEFCKHIK